MIAFLQLLLLLPPCLAATVTITASAAAEPTSAQYTNDDDFMAAILNGTNTYREQHNATALSWNDTLASYAQKWTDKCKFKHSGGPNGENLASGYPNATNSIDAWGQERKDYDFKAAKFGESTGHFTQLVWKATNTTGCARKLCDDTSSGGAVGWYVVCEYYPAGNVVGAFSENVQNQVNSDYNSSSPAGSGSEGSGNSTGSGSGSCPYPGQKCSAGNGRVDLLWSSVGVVVSSLLCLTFGLF